MTIPKTPIHPIYTAIIADGGLMNFFMRVNYSLQQNEQTTIVNVAIYNSHETALDGKLIGCVYDDVLLDELPPSSQEAIYAALHEKLHEKAVTLYRLKAEIDALKLNAHL